MHHWQAIKMIGLVAFLVMLVTGCSEGFLRKISSDDAVKFNYGDNVFTLETRDFRAQFQRKWERYDSEEYKFTGYSEYESKVINRETGVVVWIYGLLTKDRIKAGIRKLEDVAKGGGWEVKGESFPITVSGKKGQGFLAVRGERSQYFLCFRSRNTANVYILVSVPGQNDDNKKIVTDLLNESIEWKLKER